MSWSEHKIINYRCCVFFSLHLSRSYSLLIHWTRWRKIATFRNIFEIMKCEKSSWKKVVWCWWKSVKQKRWFIKIRIHISGLHISQYILSHSVSLWATSYWNYRNLYNFINTQNSTQQKGEKKLYAALIDYTNHKLYWCDDKKKLWSIR